MRLLTAALDYPKHPVRVDQRGPRHHPKPRQRHQLNHHVRTYMRFPVANFLMII